MDDVTSRLIQLTAGSLRLEAGMGKVERDIVTVKETLARLCREVGRGPQSPLTKNHTGQALMGFGIAEGGNHGMAPQPSLTNSQTSVVLAAARFGSSNKTTVEALRAPPTFDAALSGDYHQFNPPQAAAPGQQSVTTTDLHANGSEQNAASEEMRHTSTGKFSGADGHMGSLHIGSYLRNWPKDVELRPELRSGQIGGHRESQQIVASIVRQVSQCSNDQHEKRERSWVFDPDSIRIVLFDLMSFVVLLHDLMVTPYVVALDVETNALMNAFAVIATVYWFIDFVLGFNMGFYKHGELVIRRRTVTINYMKTWLFPNFIILVFDLLSHLSPHVDGDLAEKTEYALQFKLVRALKVVRLIKIFRLARLLKLMNTATTSGWLNLSRGLRAAVQMMRIVLGVVLYNHLVACLWCWLGRHTNQGMVGSRWLENYVSRADEVSILEDQNHMFLYAVGFHWTIAQMTPGPIDLVAGNIYERVFNSLLLIVGLLVCSIIVSLLSGQVTQIIIAQRDTTQKMEALETFLRQSNIRRALAVRVQRQVLERLAIGPPLTENAVLALNVLSVGLREDLLCESRKPSLFTHALFRMWQQIDAASFKTLCVEATQFVFLSVEDELFTPETAAECCYYLIRGRMVYIQTPSTSKVTEIQTESVHHRQWLCEAALWSHWVHVGRCEARMPCQILMVHAESVLQVIEKKAAVAYAVKQYGRNYHLRIHAAAPPDSDWPSDLRVPFTDIVDLCSQYFGLGLFRQALQGGKLQLSDQDRKTFERELTTERSTLQQREDGVLERIVAVVALKLHNQDGMIFVQIARFKEPEKLNSPPDVKVLCELPGSKRAIGELPQKALQRIIEEDLAVLKEAIVPIGAEDDQFTRDSPRYGMRTTYMRTVHGAMLSTRQYPEELERCRFAFQSDSPLPFLREVYTVKAQLTDEKRFFTWLTPEEFEEAAKPENQDKLQSWLPQQLIAMFHVSLAEWSAELEESMAPRTLHPEAEVSMDLDADSTCPSDVSPVQPAEVSSVEKFLLTEEADGSVSLVEGKLSAV